MQRKDTIRLASEAGFGRLLSGDGLPTMWHGADLEMLERFASLVLAAADAEAVPVAWSFEIATAMLNGQYVNFDKRLTDYAPNAPPGSVRNARPLYTRPQPAPDVAAHLAAVMQPYTSEALHRANFEQLLETLMEMLKEMDEQEDVGVLVKALERIAKAAVTQHSAGSSQDMEQIARNAIAEWEAKR